MIYDAPMMRRRRLRGGMAGAEVSAASTMDGAPTSLSVRTLQRRLTRIDEGMAFIQAAKIAWAPEERGVPSQIDAELFRAAMRSLLLTSSVNDLPAKDRGRPEVMQRLALAAPEADYALIGTMHRLSRLSGDALADIQRALDEDRELPAKLAAAIDAAACGGGVSPRRRLHLRRMLDQVLWRMQRQSVQTVVEETLAKIERLATRVARSEQLRVLFEPRPADVAHWAAKTKRLTAWLDMSAAAAVEVPGSGGSNASPPNGSPTPSGSPTGSATPPPDPSEDPQDPRKRAERAALAWQPPQELAVVRERSGSTTLKVGVGMTLLLGLPMLYSGDLIMMTGGAVLSVVGIITMIVGGIMRSMDP
jgi:hypothetical protein